MNWPWAISGCEYGAAVKGDLQATVTEEVLES